MPEELLHVDAAQGHLQGLVREPQGGGGFRHRGSERITAETPARASAGDCLPALMRQAETPCIDARGRHGASIEAVQGVFLPILWG